MLSTQQRLAAAARSPAVVTLERGTALAKEVVECVGRHVEIARRRRRSASGERCARQRAATSRRPCDSPGIGGEAAEHELLHALTFVGLGRVDVALRVDGDAVHAEELAGLAAAVAEARQDLASTRGG